MGFGKGFWNGYRGNKRKFVGTHDDDLIETGSSNDDIYALSGDDTVRSGAGNDTVVASAGDDSVKTGDGNDRAYGGTGDDTVRTGAGNDRAYGGTGDDDIRTGAGNDVASGDSGHDTIRTGKGNDWAFGENGDDTIKAGAGNDIIFGGHGDDVIRGGSGNDLAFGGHGNDKFVHVLAKDGAGHNLYVGGRGHDTLVLVLTAQEAADPAVQAEIDAFRAHLDSGARGLFSGLGFKAEGIEDLVVRVKSDGNTPPVVTPLTAGTDEDTPLPPVDFLSGASDAENDPLSVSDVPAALTTSGGRVLVNGMDFTVDGAAVFTLSATGLEKFNDLPQGVSDTALIDFTVSDGTVAVPTSLTLTIDGLNDTATATGNVSGAVAEDGILIASGQIDVTDPDTGEAGTAPQSSVQGVFGVFSIDGSGGWSYALDNDAAIVQALEQDQVEQEVFRITSADGTVSLDIRISVTGAFDAPPNTPPEAVDDTGEGNEDTQITSNVLANDSDAENNNLTARVVSGPDNGALALQSDGSFTYTPDRDFNGTDSFTYVANDGEDDSEEATVTLTVNPVNDAPEVPGPLNRTASEDDPGFDIDLLVGASDAENDPLTVQNFQVDSGDAAGISHSGNTVTVDPSAYNGLTAGASEPLEISYQIDDGNGGAITQTLSVIIGGANDAPGVAAPLIAAAGEDDPAFQIDLLQGASDPDGDLLSAQDFLVSSGDATGVVLDGNAVTVDPAAYDALNDGETKVIVLSYNVADPSGATVPQTLTVTINGADDIIPDDTSPVLNVSLTGDTGAPDDGVTSAPVFGGTVSDNVGVERLIVEIEDGPAIRSADIVDSVAPDGSFSIDLASLEQVRGSALQDGPTAISIQAQDAAGNISDTFLLPFTLDRVAPTVADAPAGVLSEAPDTLTLSFDEAVAGNAFAASMYSLTDGGGAPVEIASLTQVSDSEVQLNLAATLANGDYTLSVLPGVEDLAGNASIGSSFDFAVDGVTRVVRISPDDHTRLVNVDREITVEFDRPIDPSTLTADSFQILLGNDPVSGSIRVSSNGLLATFFLEEDTILSASSTYRILLDGTQIRDAAGGQVDLNGDGAAGGFHETTFSTVSLTRVPDTNVEGFILDSNNRGPDGQDLPLEGVVVTVVGLPEITAVTDETGRFLLEDLPTQQVYLNFDASAVTAATGFRYGSVVKPVHPVAGQTVGLTTDDGTPFDIYFAAFAEDDAAPIVAGQETVVGLGDYGLQNLAGLFPGVDPSEWQKLKVTIPADALFFDDGTPAQEVTVMAFEPDRIPAPLPDGFEPTVVFTVVAERAANVDGKAQIEFPNLDGLAPGARRPIMSFDHDAGEWVQTGTAVVSDDGTVLRSEGDTGVNTLGWKYVGNNPNGTGGGKGPGGPVITGPIGDLSDPRGEVFGDAGDQFISGLRQGGAGLINSGLVVADLIDEFVPDEELGLGILVTGAKYTVGMFANLLDDGSFGSGTRDAALNTASTALAVADAAPGSSKIADGLSAGLNAYNALNNFSQAGSDFFQGAADLTVALGLDSTADLLGPRARQKLLEGQVTAPRDLIEQIAQETIDDPSTPNNLRALAERILTAADEGEDSLDDTLDDIREEFRNSVNNLRHFAANCEKPPTDGVGEPGEGTGEPDPNAPPPLDEQAEELIQDIDNLLPDFEQKIDQAEDDFRQEVENIDLNTPDFQDKVDAFENAQQDLVDDVNQAVIDFATDLAQSTADAINLSQAALDQYGQEVSDYAASGIEFLQLFSLQGEIFDDYVAFLEALQESLFLGEDPSRFLPDAQAILDKIFGYEAELDARGFDSVDEWAETLVDRSEDLADNLAIVAGPVTEQYGAVYAQAILEDGTVIRQKLDAGENFNFIAPLGSTAQIRFFDAETNLFGEKTVTIGEDDPDGFTLFTERLTLDSDDDGIPDLGEIVIGSDPNSKDSDGDGFLDGAEAARGTGVGVGDALPNGIIAGVPLTGEALDLDVGFDPSDATRPIVAVATGSAGIALVDMTDPFAPVLLSQLDLPGTVIAVEFDVERGLVYAASEETGLHIIDISDPVTPVLDRSVALPGGAEAVQLVGGLVLAGGGTQLSLIDPATGDIVTDRQITSLFPLIDTTEFDRIDDFVLVGGDTIFALERVQQGDGLPNAAQLSSYHVGADGITSLGQVEVPVSGGTLLVEIEPMKLFVDGGVAYVSKGLEVRNVAPTRPLERGGYVTFDVNDPANMALISGDDTAFNQAGNFETITNGSGTAFVASGGFGLVLHDASDPLDTFEPVAFFDTPGDARGVALYNGLALVADGPEGLQVINTITADTVPPSLTATLLTEDVDPVAPGIQVFEGSQIDVRANVIDDVQVDRVDLALDGIPFLSNGAAPFEFSFAAPSFENGTGNTISIELQATDSSGNTGDAAPVFVEVVSDTDAPGVVGITPADGESLAAGARTVTVLFDEKIDPATLSLDAVQLTSTINPSDVLTPIELTLAASGTVQEQARFFFADIPPGNYTLSFDPAGATDLAGNPFEGGPISQSLQTLGTSARWIEGASGLWSIPANWEAGIVPGTDDAVELPLAPGTVAGVIGPVGDTRSITVNGTGTFRIDSPDPGTLFTTGELLNNAVTEVIDGLVFVDGPVTNTGTIAITNDGHLTVTGDIRNDSTILIEKDAVTGFTQLVTDAPRVNLTGGGTIELAQSGDATRGGAFQGSAPLPSNSNPLNQRIVNVDNTITGTGTVGVNAILENTAGGMLLARNGDVLTVNSGVIENRGNIIAETGGRVVFDSDQFFSGGIFAFRGGPFIDNTGGTIRAESGGVVELLDAQIQGGSLITESVNNVSGLIRIASDASNSILGLDGTVNPITIDALMSVEGPVNLSGAISNAGNIFLADGSTGQFPSDAGQFFVVEDTTFSGNGTIRLSVGNDSTSGFERMIEFDRFEFFDDVLGEAFSFGTTLNLEGQQLTGSGAIGEFRDPFEPIIYFDDEGNEFEANVINATVNVDPTSSIQVIDLGQTMEFQNVTLNNDGFVFVGPGDFLLSGESDLFNTGIVQVDGGSFEIGTGIDDFNFYSNDGNLRVENGGSISIGSGAFFSNNNFVVIETGGEVVLETRLSTSSFSQVLIGDGTLSLFDGADVGEFDFSLGDGQLILGSNAQVDHTLANFAAGDSLAFDFLDPFGSVSATVAGGLLTVSDGFDSFDIAVNTGTLSDADFEALLQTDESDFGGVLVFI